MDYVCVVEGLWQCCIARYLCVQLYKLTDTCLMNANKLHECLLWQAKVVVDVVDFG